MQSIASGPDMLNINSVAYNGEGLDGRNTSCSEVCRCLYICITEIYRVSVNFVQFNLDVQFGGLLALRLVWFICACLGLNLTLNAGCNLIVE